MGDDAKKALATVKLTLADEFLNTGEVLPKKGSGTALHKTTTKIVSLCVCASLFSKLEHHT
jgi:hypothetical protein